MKPTQLPQVLDLAYTTMRPVMIWGAPGVGKSQILAQWGDDKGLPVIDIRLSQMEPSDLSGLPSITDGVTHWARPHWFPTDTVHGPKGVLFVDEMTSAPPQMAAAAYQLILDRRIGSHTLPNGWLVIAAGNRQQDRGVVHSMPAPLANRFLHFTLEPDLDDLRRYAVKERWDHRIPAFLAFRPELMHNHDPKSKDPAFGSPRTWEFLSQALQAGIPENLLIETIHGAIGQAAGTEFYAFLDMAAKIVPPDVIMLNPDTAQLPTDAGIAYACMGALASRTTGDTLATALRYVDRVESAPQLGAEFSVLFMRDVSSIDEGIAANKAFISWAATHSEVIL